MSAGGSYRGRGRGSSGVLQISAARGCGSAAAAAAAGARTAAPPSEAARGSRRLKQIITLAGIIYLLLSNNQTDIYILHGVS